MSDTITAGATSQSAYVTIRNISTGAKKTGLLAASFNNGTPSTATYVRNKGLAVDITLSDLAAADSAWSAGGFKEVNATKAPGLYRVDLPDAALIAGARTLDLILVPASTVDAQQAEKEILITALDLQTATVSMAAAERNAIADAWLDRDMSLGTDSGSTTVRTPRQALRWLRNKWSIAAGVLTVTKENDVTASWTGAVTTDATQNAVCSIDPAGP